MATTDRKVVLVTGCAPGGIGNALAREFHSKGCHVVATARKSSDISDLEEVGMSTLSLDVTNAESISAAKKAVEELGGGRLDILVNNAGRNLTLPALDAPIDEARLTFETNFFAVHALTQTFTPLLIATAASSTSSSGNGALIVNIGSVAAYIPYVFGAIYNASKAALHAYSNTLRLELEPYNVGVMVVVTGGVKSRIARTKRELPEGSLYLYQPRSSSTKFIYRLFGPFEGREDLPSNTCPPAAHNLSNMFDTNTIGPAIFLGVTVVPSLYLLFWGANEILYRIAARKAGCSMPVKYWHWDPFLGLDLFMKRINDMKAGDSIATDRILLKNNGKAVQTNAWGIKQYIWFSTYESSHVCAVGDGLFTTDGHAWKKSRQMINPVFARAQVSELSTFEVHLARMIVRIPKDGSTVDMQPLCKMLFLDSSTEFIFAHSMKLSRQCFTRYMLGKFKFLAGSEKKCLKKCAEVHKVIDGFIDEEILLQPSSENLPDTKSTAPYNCVLLKELVKTTGDRRVI
ncbi:hypothetical protein G7Y89_g7506 [Cudoniella acicularis]|uniref:Uncharacterized protein n=1 Tax=Cudoniella acicularis TaxID=354080 RepID=A0A8H4RIE6_9HELO|nr:hypothetical protein G7Y89_g7506 [Cudoniella acicularis]